MRREPWFLAGRSWRDSDSSRSSAPTVLSVIVHAYTLTFVNSTYIRHSSENLEISSTRIYPFGYIFLFHTKLEERERNPDTGSHPQRDFNHPVRMK